MNKGEEQLTKSIEKGEVTVLETSLCICYLYLEPREKILKEKFWH